MKFLRSLQGVIILAVFSACSEAPVFFEKAQEPISSRSIIDLANDSSTTNPNLLTDWENVEYVNINNNLTFGFKLSKTVPLSEPRHYVVCRGHEPGGWIKVEDFAHSRRVSVSAEI